MVETQKLIYPMLFIMTHDLLTPNVSTVPSEFTFSTAGRVLTHTRNCLASEAIETSISGKDWLDAETRNQNKIVDEIIEDSSEDK